MSALPIARLTAVALTVGGGMLASGCNDSDAKPAAAADEVASIYKEGHGLKLAPGAATFIGVKTSPFAGTLPASALLRTIKGDFVYVENDGWLLRTPVVVGRVNGGPSGPALPVKTTEHGGPGGPALPVNATDNGGRALPSSQAGWAVTEGLYEGDKIVVSGVRALWLAELQAVNGGVGCADDH